MGEDDYTDCPHCGHESDSAEFAASGGFCPVCGKYNEEQDMGRHFSGSRRHADGGFEQMQDAPSQPSGGGSSGVGGYTAPSPNPMFGPGGDGYQPPSNNVLFSPGGDGSPWGAGANTIANDWPSQGLIPEGSRGFGDPDISAVATSPGSDINVPNTPTNPAGGVTSVPTNPAGGNSPAQKGAMRIAAIDFLATQNVTDREELLFRAHRHASNKTAQLPVPVAQRTVQAFVAAVNQEIRPEAPRRVAPVQRTAAVSDFADELLFDS